MFTSLAQKKIQAIDYSIKATLLCRFPFIALLLREVDAQMALSFCRKMANTEVR